MSRALILGLGDSGLAMARWLGARGYALRVADTRDDPPQRSALECELPDAEQRLGRMSEALLEGVDLVALSPGLSPAMPPLAALLKAARAQRADVVGEIELFARELNRLKAERGYRPQLLGITGTNGKTTTARLLGRLLQRCGRRVVVAGNIGLPALDALNEHRDDLPEVWVLELSSFQLASTRSLVCDAAVVLNLTEDHLDWHGSIDAYAAAKQRIFSPRTVQVLNRNDARVSAMARKGAELVSIGTDAPRAPASYGLVDDDGVTWLAFFENYEAAARRRRVADQSAGNAVEGHLQRLMPVAAMRLRGRHNAVNAMAALALARAIGCPLGPMLHELREYAGEPHRVQPLSSVAGVEYIDDSKGTNVGATVAALEGLGSEGRQLVVILGGDGKGQDFAPLAPALARYARAVVLIGRDAARIRSAVTPLLAADAVHEAESLESAVRTAASLAHPGDAVLLSPACASLDMFRNYVHRAEVFAAAVRELQGAECPC